MNWQESLETVVADTGHTRYRELCSDDNPDVAQREAYRALVLRQAEGKEAEEPAEILGSEALRAYLIDHPCGGCP